MLAAGTRLTRVDSSVNDPTGHAFVGSWETTSYSDPASDQVNLDIIRGIVGHVCGDGWGA